MATSEIALRTGPTAPIMERVLMVGDLSKLYPAERIQYYLTVCESLGLNPATRPFDYIVLQGKMQLYARRDATEQLRRRDDISITITAREKVGDVYVVTARATTPQQRTDEAIGAVPLDGLRGEALANAFMKAETKAKRRVTLSICGLGFTDESEVDSIPDARRVQVSDSGEIIDAPTASSETLAFGKHQGKTLEAVYAEDPDYVRWLSDKARDPIIKLAAQELLQKREEPAAEPVVEPMATVTAAQLKRLYAMAGEYSVPSALIKEHMVNHHNVSSSKELNADQYEEVCAWIESQAVIDIDLPEDWPEFEPMEGDE